MSANSSALNKKLLSQLECPVCFETCIPPIYMCSNGHSVCSQCQPQLRECSECRVPGKATARCIQLEKIARLVELPCPNKSLGCDLAFNTTDVALHLPKCKFGKHECRVCKNWKGCANDLKDHVSKVHKARMVNLPSSGKTTIDAGFDCAHYSDMLVSFGDALFWFNFRHTLAGRVFASTMRLVSHSPLETSGFEFSVEFSSLTRKLTVNYKSEVFNLTEFVSKDHTEFAIPDAILNSHEYRLVFVLSISRTASPSIKELEDSQSALIKTFAWCALIFLAVIVLKILSVIVKWILY